MEADPIELRRFTPATLYALRLARARVRRLEEDFEPRAAELARDYVRELEDLREHLGPDD